MSMQSEQSTIALFNLEYKTRDGADWNSTYTQNGTVNATHLGCYFSHSDPEAQCPTDVVVGQATANLYGEIGLASDCGNYTDISEVVNSREYKNYYCRRTPGRQEFTFRFYEFNPDDSQRTYPFFTNRTVSASAGECIVYQTVNQTHGLDLYGDLAATKYTFTNGTFTDSISIPKSNDGLNGTTFIYRGIDPPGDAFSPSVVCGLRCLWIWVHKTQGPNDNSTFYSCPITIDEVRNASFPHQQINITMARTAAASIALHGGWTGTFPNQTFTSFNFYAAGYVSRCYEIPLSSFHPYLVINPVKLEKLAQLTDSFFSTAPTGTSRIQKTPLQLAHALPNSPSPPYPPWRLKTLPSKLPHPMSPISGRPYRLTGQLRLACSLSLLDCTLLLLFHLSGP